MFRAVRRPLIDPNLPRLDRTVARVQIGVSAIVTVVILLLLLAGFVDAFVTGNAPLRLGLVALVLFVGAVIGFAADVPGRIVALMLVASVGVGIAFVVVTRNDAPKTFCDTHTCDGNFDQGRGYIVQCADGTYSHSGGIQGACSYHGGEG